MDLVMQQANDEDELLMQQLNALIDLHDDAPMQQSVQGESINAISPAQQSAQGGQNHANIGVQHMTQPMSTHIATHVRHVVQMSQAPPPPPYGPVSRHHMHDTPEKAGLRRDKAMLEHHVQRSIEATSVAEQKTRDT